MLIKYVGKKSQIADRLWTGNYIWNGNGDIVDVEEPEVVQGLLSYPDIWEAVQEPAPDPAAENSPADGVKSATPKRVVRSGRPRK